MASSTSGFIFHERQQSALCGQHCLNNLLQASIFTPGDLADIAQELDAAERRMMMEMGTETADAIKFLAEESGNVDESGNFSIQVLNEALERSNGIALTNFGSEALRVQTDDSLLATDKYEAFVFNRESHWFTVTSHFYSQTSIFHNPPKLQCRCVNSTGASGI
jgi:Ataxin-3